MNFSFFSETIVIFAIPDGHIKNPTLSVHAYLLEEQSCQIHPDPIWLGFSEELCLNKNNKMSSDIGWPVPDPEMYAFNKWMHNYVAEESSVY